MYHFEEWLYGGPYDTYQVEEKGVNYFGR